jgi:hypothetical protein
MVEDLLDDRPLRDCRDDLELPNAAARAVLHWQCNSRMQRKPPDQAAPNWPLLSACSWPGLPARRRSGQQSYEMPRAARPVVVAAGSPYRPSAALRISPRLPDSQASVLRVVHPRSSRSSPPRAGPICCRPRWAVSRPLESAAIAGRLSGCHCLEQPTLVTCAPTRSR